MNKQAIKIGAVVLILAGVIFAGIRIYSVNSKYPDPKIINYKQGEDIKGGDIVLNVAKSDFLTYNDIMQVCPDYKNQMKVNGKTVSEDDVNFLVAEIQMKNESDEVKKTSLTQVIAESGAWSNAFDMDLFIALNNIDKVYISLDGHEERTFKVPYIMYKSQFKSSEWESVKDREYELVLSTYPVKNQVILNVQ